MADLITFKCPVCGKEKQIQIWSECGIGTVEYHFYCDNCTYFEDMCYSNVYRGITKDCPKQFKTKIKELKINIVSDDMVP